MKTLSAHQINFFPYCGVFEKIRQADVFVMMKHVTFPKNNYVNRFYYKEKWYTMRCNQSHELIWDKRYLYAREDWMKITSELPKLKIFDRFITERIELTNDCIIRECCRILGIDTVLSPDWPTSFSGTDRLIDYCRLFSADTYLSGVSGPKYLELDKFERAGIKVIFQSNPDKRALVDLL